MSETQDADQARADLAALLLELYGLEQNGFVTITGMKIDHTKTIEALATLDAKGVRPKAGSAAMLQKLRTLWELGIVQITEKGCAIAEWMEDERTFGHGHRN